MTSDLNQWLEERRDNARRIAATKVTPADIGGWIEDANYFEAAIERIANHEREMQVLRDALRKSLLVMVEGIHQGQSPNCQRCGIINQARAALVEEG